MVACSNPLKPEGEWVSKIDLVQEGDQLQLATQPTHGHCKKERGTEPARADARSPNNAQPPPSSSSNSTYSTLLPAVSCQECRTVEQACNDVLDKVCCRSHTVRPFATFSNVPYPHRSREPDHDRISFVRI